MSPRGRRPGKQRRAERGLEELRELGRQPLPPPPAQRPEWERELEPEGRERSARRRADGGQAGRRRAVRRRRLMAGGAVIAVAAVIAVVVALLSGGKSGPHYTPGGAAVATVLNPAAPPAAKRQAKGKPFTPAPAAKRLASSLTLAQQVAQLFIVSASGTTSTSAVSGLGSTPWGGVVLARGNYRSQSQLTELTGGLAAAAQSAGTPAPLIAAGQDGGPNTAFPGLPPEGEDQVGANPTLAEGQAKRAGKALKALGVQMTVAPLADVDTVDGALSGELFSQNPATVAKDSLAAVQGYTGTGEIAAAAHFPGAGAASADPDLMTATVGGSLAALESRDLIPFQAITPTVPVVMMSNAEYVAFDGATPASLLPAAVKLLRDQYGFSGVVMSDDLDATLDATGETPAQVAVQALQAGDDLLYISGPPSEHLQAYQAVLALAQKSADARALVHAALLEDLTLKAHAGLLSGS